MRDIGVTGVQTFALPIYEARVGLASGPLRLADRAPPPRPAVQGGPAEVLEAARRLARPGRRLLGPGQIDGEFLDQAGVAGQAEDEVDAAGLAPGHERLAGEAGIRSEQDPNTGPAGADPADDALDLPEGSGRAVDVGAAELGRRQVSAAESAAED